MSLITKYSGDGSIRKSDELAAGWDIAIAGDVTVNPGELCKIRTGVHIEFKPGVYGLVVGRSSLAVKKRLMVIPGVIDNDYRGEIIIVVQSLSTKFQYRLHEGDYIAQLLVLPTVETSIQEVVGINKSTRRGESGFGSTGGYA